jgi:hypothetical protein
VRCRSDMLHCFYRQYARHIYQPSYNAVSSVQLHVIIRLHSDRALIYLTMTFKNSITSFPARIWNISIRTQKGACIGTHQDVTTKSLRPSERLFLRLIPYAGYQLVFRSIIGTKVEWLPKCQAAFRLHLPIR